MSESGTPGREASHMSIGSMATQLGVRLALIGAILTAAGITSYSATHWEPRAYHAPSDQQVTARQ